MLAVLIVLVVMYLRRPNPCQYPLTYRIGIVNKRFGLAPQEFGRAVNRAAVLWGNPLSRYLFQEDSQGLWACPTAIPKKPFYVPAE